MAGDATVKGGAKLEQKLQQLANQKNAHVNIGFLEGETYDDGQSVAQVAFWQEFGTTRAPARPFFRPVIEKHRSEWIQLVKELAAEGIPIRDILVNLGQTVRDQLVLSIRDGPHKPLSPITLMLRKMKDEGQVITGRSLAIARARVAAGEQGATGSRAIPLIDTRTMYDAPNYEVKDA